MRSGEPRDERVPTFGGNRLTRVAAVDIGTNSTRLLVADVADGRVDEVIRLLQITRLGEGVDATATLKDTAMARVHSTLAGFRDRARGLGAEIVLATATSAVRDASNGQDFLTSIEEQHGFATRLLSGDEEAEMTLRGVTSDRSIEPGTLLVDIGGGSTELVLGGPGGVDHATSLQLGCVRLTERFLNDDPPTAEQVEACAAHVRSLLPTLQPARAIGVAGTVTTLAGLDLELERYDARRIHGHILTRVSVERELGRLAAATLEERERLLHIEPARAPVIVGGAIALLEILSRYHLADIEVSERDILYGAALAAVDVARSDHGRG